jgi:adenine/guanine phosphoribosyltransferase-like PRPP-binding protein
VAVIDDVISTGASIRAALALARRVEADPVVVGTLVTEGSEWRGCLGDDVDRVRTLGSLPIFRRTPDGELEEDWT